MITQDALRDTLQETVDLSAFRYALGRKTYVVSETVEYLIGKADSLSGKARNLIIKEIEQARDCGHNCDHRDWMRLLKVLKESGR